MPIVGFGFTKISAQKGSAIKGKVDIKTNVTIKDVTQADMAFGKEKGNVVRFVYEYAANYEPNVGNLHIEGDILYLSDSAKAKEMLESWKKGKKVPQDVMLTIMNNVFTKCSIQALVLSQEVNLPSPIRLPGLQAVKAPAPAKK